MNSCGQSKFSANCKKRLIKETLLYYIWQLIDCVYLDNGLKINYLMDYKFLSFFTAINNLFRRFVSIGFINFCLFNRMDPIALRSPTGLVTGHCFAITDLPHSSTLLPCSIARAWHYRFLRGKVNKMRRNNACFWLAIIPRCNNN